MTVLCCVKMSVNRSSVFIICVVFCLASAHFFDVCDAYSQRESNWSGTTALELILPPSSNMLALLCSGLMDNASLCDECIAEPNRLMQLEIIFGTVFLWSSVSLIVRMWNFLTTAHASTTGALCWSTAYNPWKGVQKRCLALAGVLAATPSQLRTDWALVWWSSYTSAMASNHCSLHTQEIKLRDEQVVYLITGGMSANNNTLPYRSELFNLPVAALWTAVLGEWDRAEQKGSYVPIEKVILHHRFHNYQHDIALMKMTRAADVSAGSRIRTICLPSYESPLANYEPEKGTSFYVRSNSEGARKKSVKRPKPNPDTASKYMEKLNNLTKTSFPSYSNKKHKNLRYNIRMSNDSDESVDKRNDKDLKTDDDENRDVVYDRVTLDRVVKLIQTKTGLGADADNFSADVREVMKDEDKDEDRVERKLMFGEEIEPFVEGNSVEARDECYATGWGRQQTNGSLTDVLLEAEVPLLPLATCRDRYALPLPLGAGHLCAGSTDGSTGACVGDSGGPLQCRSGGSGGAGGRVGGRWELRGLTSFGSGCARRGVPDVYTNVAHYTAWIYAHIYAG